MTKGHTLPAEWETSIDGWAAWMRAAGMAPDTIRTRTGHLHAVGHTLWCASPWAVTGADLVAMSATHEWSNEHRRGRRTALTRFYSWAVAAGLTMSNPALELPRVPDSPPHPRPATDQIWADLLAAATPKVALMARLAAEAGLRRGEVARAHRDDITSDLFGCSLIVRGKGDKQRMVPINDNLAAAILTQPPGYLFPGHIDGHISPDWVSRQVSALMPAGWSMHKLRHRYASRGFAATGDLLAVQTALGHASVATTQRYVAVTPQSVRAVSEAAA